MQKIKVGDEVVVISGKYKGKIGCIKKIDYDVSRVVIEGVSVVKKAIKPSNENPAGGFLNKELPLSISNIAILSPKLKKPTRVKIVEKDSKKIRVAVKCGTVLK